MKQTISACLIIKNAEKTLSRALESVKWCDEIIILDSGSTDQSLAIARTYTDKIFENTDWQGFGKQRQLAQSYANSAWVLFLDADEYLSDTLQASIQTALHHDKNHTTCYKINRLSSAFSKPVKHSGWFPDYLIRLYPTALTQYSGDLVHEAVVCPSHADTQHLDGLLYHDAYDDLGHYLQKVIPYTHAWAVDRCQRKSSSLLKASIHGIGAFFRLFFLKRGILDGRVGFLLAVLTAFTTFIKYADLAFLNEAHKNTDTQHTK